MTLCHTSGGVKPLAVQEVLAVHTPVRSPRLLGKFEPVTAGKTCGLDRCYLSSSGTIGPPLFFRPSRIGRGGPFLGTVTSTHSSSPDGRRAGSERCSEMKNATGL